jgi:rhodanese-related sulfurtransferase
MRIATVVGAIALGLPLLSDAVGLTFESAAVPQPAVKMGEWGLRESASFAPMPEYPRESLSAKVSGVVVADVVFGLDGRAKSVEILESPDALTAAAVRDAVSRWTVPGGQGSGLPDNYAIRGKLTFYFQFRNGKGRVHDPDQMPHGIPRPKPRPAVTISPSGVPQLSVPPPPPKSMPGSHGETLETITVAAFKKEAASTKHLVLDSGEREAFKRGHWPGAVNIPLDELAVRGGPELPRERLIVVDCTREDMQLCRWAGGRLVEQKFPNVVLLVR